MNNENNSISSDLIRGHINTIILKTLYEGDKHGNDICREIEERSHGQYEIKQPTLYSSLKRLEQQGLVKAYWSGLTAGGRRRYFKLTDEGRKVTEESLSEWVHSRDIINKLILQSGEDSFDIPEANSDVDAEIDDIATEEATVDLETPIIPEPIIPVLKTTDDADEESKQIAKENEEQLASLDNNRDIKVEQLSLMPEEKKEEPKEPEPITIQVEPEPEKIVEPIEEKDDDALILEKNSNFDREYTDILKKILPKAPPEEEPIPEPIKEEPPKPRKVDKVSEPLTQAKDEEPIVNDALDIEKINEVIKEKPKTVAREENSSRQEQPKSLFLQKAQSGEIDYSNLHALARQQNFRLRSSDQTNKSTNGKLMIYKLNVIASLTFFLVLMIELALVCFPFSDILKFGIRDYLIIPAIVFVFPLCTIVCFCIKPRKTADEVVTFKYAISTSLIIAFNVILFIFAFALVRQIDFSSARDLILYIFVPSIIALNFPLYVIFKYIYLEKGWFYQT